MEMKKCKGCEVLKPLSNYYKCKTGDWHGYRPWCKDCTRIKSAAIKKQWKHNNPEKVAEQRQRYVARNPEKSKTLNRARSARRVEVRRETTLAWRTSEHGKQLRAEREREHRSSLSRRYVAQLLRRSDKELFTAWAFPQDLIDAKREQLSLRRLERELKQVINELEK